MSYSVLNQDNLQTLVRLGLTLRKAKVYLALLQPGLATVETISKISKIPRPDLYRIMVELQEDGLTEKIIGIPVRFKATPIQDGITILLNRKIKETAEIQQAANELLKKFKEATAIIQEEKDQFVLIPRKEALAKRTKKQRKNHEHTENLNQTIKEPVKRFWSGFYSKKVGDGGYPLGTSENLY